MLINRKQRPKDKIVSNFHLPEIQRNNLENGLDIYLIENHKLPIVKLNLVIPAGSKFDSIGSEGLAYLTALTVDEGAGNFQALQLANEIDKLGSSIDISTSVDNIFIKLTSLHENFERTLELFSMIIKEPLFDNESFDREKKKQLTKITQSFDDPGYIAANAFQKTIFKGTGYETPILGYSNSVKNIERQVVRDFYSKFFNSSKSKMMVVGSLSMNELTDLLDKYFSDFNFDNNINDTEFNFSNQPSKLYFIDKEGAAQSEIVVGQLVKDRLDEQFFAARVANTILGGQFTSRINLNLREDKGYTYGAHSSISYNNAIGYFSLSTSVQSEFTLNSLKEIHKEITGIRKEIRDEEIDFAKSTLVKQFPSMFETYSQLLQRLNSKILFDLPDNYYNKYVQNILDVTKEEILKAANDYLQPESLAYFVVGSKEFIVDDLKTFDHMDLLSWISLECRFNYCFPFLTFRVFVANKI